MANETPKKETTPHFDDDKSSTLCYEAVYGDNDALNEHPHREDDREGESDEDIVAEEDDTYDDLQQARQRPGSAIGKEELGFESKDQF